MYSCKVIGISDSRKQWFSPEVREIIACGRVFSGGKRHYEIVADMLPEGAEWIDIAVPLSGVFRQYKAHDEVIVFASGDPLFYGFANTVQRECPGVEMKVYPSFHSLQMLAHRLCLPYHDMKMVSQTGRPWLPLDEALISGESLIGVLTDKKKTPQKIAQRMMDYGYDNYEVTVGECLGNENDEKLCVYKALKDLATEKRTFAVPNCMILQLTSVRRRPFGIPESEFEVLEGRPKMITKMPVRLMTLSLLDLRERKTMWDVGFCTGSVSIEAKLQFPHLDITAFEIREEGRRLMHENTRRFGTPGITTVIGDFLKLDLRDYPRPDAVFIGGHGGKLGEMVQKVKKFLRPGGVIVFNSVSQESTWSFVESIEDCGFKIVAHNIVKVDSNNPINVIRVE